MKDISVVQRVMFPDMTFRIPAGKRARVIYSRTGSTDSAITFFSKPQNTFVNWQFVSKVAMPGDGRWYEYDNQHFYAFGTEKTLLLEASITQHGSEFPAGKVITNHDPWDKKIIFLIFKEENDAEVNSTVVVQLLKSNRGV